MRPLRGSSVVHIPGMLIAPRRPCNPYSGATHAESGPDDKFWVQRDGTEYGIARELEDAGIPKERIVLAFHLAEDRPFTGYAVA
jgi:hypothetical protein